jgi:hypothetical protein
MIWSQPRVVARKSVVSESARKAHNFVNIQLREPRTDFERLRYIPYTCTSMWYVKIYHSYTGCSR